METSNGANTDVKLDVVSDECRATTTFGQLEILICETIDGIFICDRVQWFI